MSERANRSAYTNWHDAAVVDEAVARTHLTLGQAWVTARTAATGASTTPHINAAVALMK